MEYACIGSRDISTEQQLVCRSLGSWIVRQGHRVHSGNAQGSDQAFAAGGNSVDPQRVHLHLPWASYEEQAVVDGNVVWDLEFYPPHLLQDLENEARTHHPAWGNLTQGVHKLMTRNAGIILPLAPGFPDIPVLEKVHTVFAYPSQKRGGGGTGHGIRIAKAHHIRVVDLNQLDREGLRDLCEEIRAT